MKVLRDGFEVSARSYYFLLDWNDMNDWALITYKFGKYKLSDLTRAEYKELFEYAANDQINVL